GSAAARPASPKSSRNRSACASYPSGCGASAGPGQAEAPMPKTSQTAAEARIAELERELAEARAQQDTTAGVLRVMRGSLADRQAVLDAIAAAAGGICPAATYALVSLVDGDNLRVVATWSPTAGGVPVGEARPLDPRSNT